MTWIVVLQVGVPDFQEMSLFDKLPKGLVKYTQETLKIQKKSVTVQLHSLISRQWGSLKTRGGRGGGGVA